MKIFDRRLVAIAAFICIGWSATAAETEQNAQAQAVSRVPTAAAQRNVELNNADDREPDSKQDSRQDSLIAQTSIADTYNQLAKLNDRGKVLAGVQLLQDILADDKSQAIQSQIKDILGQQMTFAGQYSRAINEAESRIVLSPDFRSEGDELPADALAQLTPVPALDAIVAEARHHRIVVINEAHNVGATRAFNRRVVRALAGQGFRYLAAETFDDGIEQANQDHRVRRNVGYYSNDPVYASIMRSAWASGYRLLRYEAAWSDRDTVETPCDRDAQADWVAKVLPEGGEKNILWREKHEACNLALALARMPRDAKLVVVVGYSHVRKTEDADGLRWMASFLEGYTSESILAIDQTQQDPHRKLSDANPLVKQIYATFSPTVESVYRKPDGTYLLPKSMEHAVDMAVFRPNPRDKDNWWRPDDELMEVTLDAPDKGASWPIGLVMALPRGDAPAEIVPLDSFYVWKSGIQQVRLLLPKGAADIWVEIGGGDLTKIGRIEVTGRPDDAHPVLRQTYATNGQTLEQILDLPAQERNQALAALRDSGELLPEPQEGPPDLTATGPSECNSYEESDRQTAPVAAVKASSGAAFLLAESQTAELIAKARERVQAVDGKAPQSGDPMVAELLRRRDRDQVARTALLDPPTADKPLSPVVRYIFDMNWWAYICPIDHANTAWMQKQLATIGWFDIREYGESADGAAWLLVQHADDNPDFQIQTLDVLAKLQDGGTSRRSYAYLYDRVAIHQGRPERFGTQGRCVGKEWQPFPTEQPEQLDARRAQVGLEPEDENRKRFNCDG